MQSYQIIVILTQVSDQACETESTLPLSDGWGEKIPLNYARQKELVSTIKLQHVILMKTLHESNNPANFTFT
jgi:hypothetical protein